jgi:hypothetical protein
VQGLAAAAPWYEAAKATYVGLVDPAHRISALYNLVNVPSAVWIDEAGIVRRIDEGTYATIHKSDNFEFGREDYAPMVANWVEQGDASPHVSAPVKLPAQSDADEAKAAPAFRLGVYFKQQDDSDRAETYWRMAQKLNPDSWNYHRQDWAYTPEEAGANWVKKVQTLGDRPYYKPVEGLDKQP